MKFPFIRQLDTMDCGPTCLRMIAKYYGRIFSTELVNDKCEFRKDGVSLLNISEAASALGFNTVAVKTNIEALSIKSKLPCIAYWKGRHFIVIYKITKRKVFVADPARGKVSYKHSVFIENWAGEARCQNFQNQDSGIVLYLEPNGTNLSDDSSMS